VVENVDDTVTGQLVENIMASIAQFYSANLADEVKKGMRQKILKGGWPHLPPRGYISVRHSTDTAAHVEVHPTEGPIVRQAFELYATGFYSLKRLAAWMAGQGLTSRKGMPLAAGYLQGLLANPFYAGRVRWKDLDITGTHEAMVSGQLFARIGAVLANRFRQPGAKGSVGGFVLRGIAICATCRGHMTAGIHKRKGYYNCSRRSYNKGLCSAVSYCRADLAHESIAHICGKLRVSQSTGERVLSATERMLRERALDADHRCKDLQAQRAKLIEQEAQLTRSFVAGDVSAPVYKRTAEDLRNRVIGMEDHIRQLTQNPAALLTFVDGVLKHAESISELAEELNDARRTQLLHKVFDTIVLDGSGVIGFTLHKPFETLFKAGDAPNSLGDAERGIDALAHDLLKSAALGIST
jgi:hypothetical protein